MQCGDDGLDKGAQLEQDSDDRAAGRALVWQRNPVTAGVFVGEVYMDDQTPLNRRSFLGRVVGGAVLAGGASALVAGSAARAQTTDSDPSDGYGRGRGSGTGATDSDPTDAGGRGRSGVTDSDPTDGSGRGRGRRASDSDPTDPAAASRF